MNRASRKNIGESVILKTILLTMLLTGIVFAGKPIGDKNKQGLNKITANDHYQTFLINNIYNFYSNNGDGSYNNYHGSSGLEFPKGSGNFAVFEDGFLIGGKTRTSAADTTKIVKVGGSAYRHGWQAGKIVTPGTATTTAVGDNPSTTGNRIYKVRPDVRPGILLDAALSQKLQTEELDLIARDESGTTVQSIYDQYITDWNEWPAAQGAPFDDKNGNGVYDKNIDSAGVAGADQTLWHVSNDLDAARTKFLYGSDPIGLELQRTIWGYKRGGAIGNTIFTKYKIINKSGAAIESTYVAQWSDPDLGGAGDDYCGSDTVLSLGYVYNGKALDEQYGTKTPASGYDFFQGPIVPSIATDSAKVGGKYKKGFKNLKMTSFNFFVNGNATYTDPAQGTIAGTVSWFRLMKGLIGSTGGPYINPITGQVTTFVLTGDPVTNAGWVDGVIAPPGDRRLSMSSGPFTMANGDTQEVVVATIVGQGGDRLSSISVLKFYDKAAQAAYDANFDLAPPPASPAVKIFNAEGGVVLNWGDMVASNLTESNNAKGYKFQGYNIYQNKTSSYSPDNAKLLGTFDLNDGIGVIRDEVYDGSVGTTVVKPVQFGTDNGLARTFTITNDAFTSQPLVNGRSYYFFVTAYNYNPDPLAIPNNLESAPALIEVIPQSPAPGVRLGQKAGDTLKVVHASGISEGGVFAIVVDPTKLTGHNYRVDFDTAGGNGSTYWKLTDVTTSTVIFNKQYNQTGDGDYYSIDGLLIKTTGPATPGMKDWSIPNGARRWTWADGDGLGFEGFNGAIGWDEPAHIFGSIPERTVPASAVANVLIKFATASSGTAKNTNVAITGDAFYADTAVWNASTDPNFSYGYRYVRGGTGAPARPEFAPYVGLNAGITANYGFGGYNKNTVPFSAWNTDVNPPVRLAVGFLENNVPTGLVEGRYWSYPNGVGIANAGATGREWFFIFATPYTDATPNNAYKVSALTTGLPIMYTGTVMRRGGANVSSGDEFQILANHINTLNDVFTFTAPAATSSVANAKADVAKINVFPNPYFGLNARETNKYNRFVTFNHLPQKATIRIFNVAGILLKTIKKDDATQFAQWDLRNEASLPAGAGMYIVHVDMPEIGTTKILKLAIIPEVQFLDKF
ncbi:MAG: T9SS type A sorting domain-containing protein [Bacteroidota bacterium]|nr:T9SS type A sorting domain-containing protein [Bacteroidota bacterium]